MKRFRFTLQAVRAAREREELRAIEVYWKAAARQQECRLRLDEAESILEQAGQEFRERTARGVSGASLQQLQSHYLERELRKKNCERALAECASALAQASDQLVTARQRREVVEKYYEHQRSRYLQEARLEESKLLDEFGLRQRGGGPARSDRSDLESSRN